MKKILAIALSLFAYFNQVTAQPAWSRGIQTIPVVHNDCMVRAENALKAEGYTIQNKDVDFVAGQKEIHSAVITCNATADSRSYVNIFVASTSNDGGVPGLERVKLQQRMNNTIPNVTPASKTYEWFDNGGSLGTITLYSGGSAKQTWRQDLVHTWAIDSNGDLIISAQGTQWVIRFKFDPATNAFYGERDKTSQTQDGVKSVLKPK